MWRLLHEQRARLGDYQWLVLPIVPVLGDDPALVADDWPDVVIRVMTSRPCRAIAGRCAVIVRSENSWHAVSPVVAGSARSRRSMNVIFDHPGGVSTMWPPGDTTPLHRYDGGDDAKAEGVWSRLRRRLAF